MKKRLLKKDISYKQWILETRQQKIEDELRIVKKEIIKEKAKIDLVKSQKLERIELDKKNLIIDYSDDTN